MSPDQLSRLKTECLHDSNKTAPNDPEKVVLNSSAHGRDANKDMGEAIKVPTSFNIDLQINT